MTERNLEPAGHLHIGDVVDQRAPSLDELESVECNCLQLLNKELQATFDRLQEARARVWIPTFGKCVQAYKAIEALESELRALERFRDILDREQGG